jgi:chromosome segregation ATPase
LKLHDTQGLILSKALKAKKDAKDESTRITFGNLRSEVIELQHQVEEKEEILSTLARELIENRIEFTKSSKEKDDKILKLEDEKT